VRIALGWIDVKIGCNVAEVKVGERAAAAVEYGTLQTAGFDPGCVKTGMMIRFS
jgi:hypothetical protein